MTLNARVRNLDTSNDFGVLSSPAFAAARALLLYAVLFKFGGIRLWPHAYAGEAYAPSRMVYYSEFLVTLFALGLAGIHLRLFRDIVRDNVMKLAFISYATISSLMNPTAILIPFLNSMNYFEILIAIYLVVKVDSTKDLMRIIVNSATIFLVLNFLSLSMPSQSFMVGDFSGVFRGLTSHRNDLSHVSALYLIISLFAGPLISGRQKSLNIGLALIMIASARSIQGIVLAMLCAAFVPLFNMSNGFRRGLVVALTVAASIFALAIIATPSEVEGIFEYFGRDTTFSGRDRIWGLSIYLISEMPFYGYGSGFVSSDTISTGLLREYGLGTLFRSAHNSYLEAILAYGWIGGGIFLAMVVGSAGSMVRIIWSSRDRREHLAAVLLFFAIVGGVTASEKLFLPGFGWLTFVLATALIDECRTKSVARRPLDRAPSSWKLQAGRPFPVQPSASYSREAQT